MFLFQPCTQGPEEWNQVTAAVFFYPCPKDLIQVAAKDSIHPFHGLVV